MVNKAAWPHMPPACWAAHAGIRPAVLVLPAARRQRAPAAPCQILFCLGGGWPPLPRPPGQSLPNLRRFGSPFSSLTHPV